MPVVRLCKSVAESRIGGAPLPCVPRGDGEGPKGGKGSTRPGLIYAACGERLCTAAFPSPVSRGEFDLYASLLPEGLRLFATYALAHRAYLDGDYGRCVGMAENALSMKQESYPVPEVFLHLIAAVGWINQREADRANAHFMRAWQIAQPDGLIEIVGEHHGLLQGVLESCLKKGHPQEFAEIIKVTERFSRGWRRVHNPGTGATVAESLTTTEFAIAMLACRGWTNDEIAAHMGISRGTVKNRLSNTYAKLGITSRAALKQFVLL